MGVDSDEEEEILDWTMVAGTRIQQDKQNRTCEKCFHGYHGHEPCEVCSPDQPCHGKQQG
jgi:hypothetical protein